MMTREEAISYLSQIYATTYSERYRDALRIALSALRPVSREQVKKAEWIWSTGDVYICSSCGEKTHVDECMGTPIYNFCPFCMAPMTDEAVQMVMEKWIITHALTLTPPNEWVSVEERLPTDEHPRSRFRGLCRYHDRVYYHLIIFLF